MIEFTLKEFFDMLILTIATGFIFSDLFNIRTISYTGYVIKDNKNSFLLAIYSIVPGIILHELFHKITAVSFGAQAYFNTSYFFLIFTVILKLIGSPFLFLAPAYVSIKGNLSPINYSLIAFMGPFANFLLYLTADYILKSKSKLFSKIKENNTNFIVLNATKRINFFLFWFNLIPLPGFDGSKVLYGILQTLGF